MFAVVHRLAEMRWEAGLRPAFDLPYTISPWDRMWDLARARMSHSAKWLISPALSAVVHATVLAIYANLAADIRPIEPMEHLLTATEADPEEESVPLDPDFSLRPDDEPQEDLLSSLAMSVAPLQADDAVLENARQVTIEEVTVEAPMLTLESIEEIKGMLQDDLLLREGTIGAHEVAHVEGAVDRLTYEISEQLDEHKLLVVWLMDASLSLAADRQEVADRLQRIYSQLEQVNPSHQDLLSAVVSFGEKADEMVGPTNDVDKVVAAMKKIPNDESGIENVFQTVYGSAERYKVFHTRERRRIMFIIWTDESGDDYSRLEDAVALCQKQSIMVYAVGPSAMFGQEIGKVAYKHPEDGQVYMLPVSRGPDAIRQERLRLPYWFKGPQHETLHSGLAPFALARLTGATGGMYFIKDHEADASPFRLEEMQDYLPEYNSSGEYMRRASASPLRSAILKAVDVTFQRKLKDTPQLRFAPTANDFQQQMREAQETVAYNSAILDEALAAFGSKGLEDAYKQEKSYRWRAWYDLTYGRLLAMRVRCNEYNWACAIMKGKGTDFVEKQSNRWEFVPDAKLNFGTASDRQAAESLRLLNRCVQLNPNTPWSMLAQRELVNPLGFKVNEAYDPPPPPPKPMVRPANPVPPPPRAPDRTRRTEQPQVLKKPEQVKLPKL
ncbi:MAG: vWA domain-containing protein [Pirellulales bacterium]